VPLVNTRHASCSPTYKARVAYICRYLVSEVESNFEIRKRCNRAISVLPASPSPQRVLCRAFMTDLHLRCLSGAGCSVWDGLAKWSHHWGLDHPWNLNSKAKTFKLVTFARYARDRVGAEIVVGKASESIYPTLGWGISPMWPSRACHPSCGSPPFYSAHL